MALLGTVLLTALSLTVLPNCEMIRSLRLTQPIELFLLSDRQSEAFPLPYTDPTGAISGYLGREPGLVIERVDEIIVETKRMPIFSKGQVTGKMAHRSARIVLLRRDQRALEAFTQNASGWILLTRMNGRIIFTTYLSAPLTGPEFVVSGPENPDTIRAIQTIQASLPGAVIAMPGDK